MAVNTGRPVLTQYWPGASQDTTSTKKITPVSTNDGVLTKYRPGTTNNEIAQQTGQAVPFSNEDAYRLQSQGYSDLGNNSLAQAYGDIANNLGAYSNFANNSLGSYDALLNYIKGNEQGLQNVAGKLYNNLVGDIQTQRDYINEMFGPNGQLTREVNTYYDDLGNYLATDAGRQAAEIAAQGMHSGASLGAIRAQQNQAYNESFGRYIQAKEQQINAKQQLASNLINYMSTLRQEYGDTTNQYIIELYKRANDMYNTIAQSAAKDLLEYNNLRLSSNGVGGEQGGVYYDIYGNQIDENGRIIKTKSEIDKEITASVPFKDSKGNWLFYVTYRDGTTETVNPMGEAANAQWDITSNTTPYAVG